ncbi:MAG: hypothetical protein ABIR70_17365 [Bryobacteraceae bacterium]
MRKLLASTLLAAAAWAQPTVAPTGEPVGITRGENASGYNVKNSFELGARFHSVGGDEGTYRSTVNYGNGLRLLGSSLSVQSLDGHGKYFDQIQLNTQGLGNDPYQYASLRIEKNRLYRYDLTWRSNAYYNPGLRSDHSQHFADTTRNYQDQDLTLLPQSPIKFFLGFSRNIQTGPAITSAQLFDSRGDQYPLFANIRRQQHEYRAGFEAALAGWRLNLMHGWVNFKEDNPIRLPVPSDGYNVTDVTTLTSFQRNEPYHGNSPYWRLFLLKESRAWAVNGRFTYVKGQRSFVQDSTGFGTDRFGGNVTQQVYTAGNAQRPAATGNLNVSLFPSTKLTITNQTSLSHIRMSGSSVFTMLTNGSPIRPFVPFEFLGIRTIANATDADYRPFRWFGLRLGYQYSTRRVRSIQTANPTGIQPLAEQENGLHTGILGVRLRPSKSLTINLDGEIGRADQPFYPVSGKNFQAFRGRIEYRRDAFRFAGYLRTDYNVNSGSLYSYASRNRQYGADGTWTISRTFFVDASYAKLHLDTLGSLNYFSRVGNSIVGISNDRSYYVSNLHTANLSAHFVAGNRVDVSLGFSHTQDTGDGRATAIGAGSYASLPVFQSVQTFPLRFTSPQGKISVRIHEKLRWNLGYQHYGYAEQFSALLTEAQNFRAHTGYTSVTWSF